MPFTDTAPRHRLPILVSALIAGLVACYLAQRGATPPGVLTDFALVPVDIGGDWRALLADPWRALSRPMWLVRDLGIPICGSSLQSAGPLHLATSVVFLWVFGDNVEGRLGRWRFVLLWLVGAATAGLCHVWLHPMQVLPVVGASGAIAAVLGAYIVLFRKACVRVLRVVEVPCWIFFAAFFALQARPVQQAFGWVAVLEGIDLRAHLLSLATGLALAPLLLLANPCPDSSRARRRKAK